MFSSLAGAELKLVCSQRGENRRRLLMLLLATELGGEVLILHPPPQTGAERRVSSWGEHQSTQT